MNIQYPVRVAITPPNEDQDRYRFVDSTGELLGESKFQKIWDDPRLVEELIN
jgi:hypothetical protein